jgi:hypothetical protein
MFTSKLQFPLHALRVSSLTNDNTLSFSVIPCIESGVKTYSGVSDLIHSNFDTEVLPPDTDLVTYVYRLANFIAVRTRRGAGNIVYRSSDSTIELELNKMEIKVLDGLAPNELLIVYNREPCLFQDTFDGPFLAEVASDGTVRAAFPTLDEKVRSYARDYGVILVV